MKIIIPVDAIEHLQYRVDPWEVLESLVLLDMLGFLAV